MTREYLWIVAHDGYPEYSPIINYFRSEGLEQASDWSARLLETKIRCSFRSLLDWLRAQAHS